MLAKRIIPCLDVKNGRTVKGTNFIDLRDAGDAVELAARYVGEGADELVFLDITATNEKRSTLLDLVKKVALQINIPFTVGGGISEISDIENLLNAGADKVSINTAAVKNPGLIEKAALNFGSQCIVVAIDANFVDDEWRVFLNGGRVSTDINVCDWAKKVVNLGAGEILLTSMRHDGTKSGFALELTRQISDSVNVPIIASGGAGKIQDFVDVFSIGKADAALAASVFHFKEIDIPNLKIHLHENQIPVRL
ncbi:MAG: imidazole glycerol phosphate synthase subunit HisF [Pyrinomonadaceae bacterium]|nr:imidazole glycerol phosphate synthase subunit HisF [Pyrinomonadaceae bacterium]